MIATIKEEVVEKNKRLTEEELLEIIAIASRKRRSSYRIRGKAARRINR